MFVTYALYPCAYVTVRFRYVHFFVGYRPILEAMKTFAVDANPKEGRKCADIEVSYMYDALYVWCTVFISGC